METVSREAGGEDGGCVSPPRALGLEVRLKNADIQIWLSYVDPTNRGQGTAVCVHEPREQRAGKLP